MFYVLSKDECAFLFQFENDEEACSALAENFSVTKYDSIKDVMTDNKIMKGVELLEKRKY